MGTGRARRRWITDDAVYPFVFVHGLLGFSTIGPRGRLQYFRGVMEHLERNPDVLDGQAKVYVVDVDPLDTIPSRAIQLRDFIQERVLFDRDGREKHEKVNIVAHSMGGLDARYMVANLALDRGDRDPMAQHVASLTTIGTPPRGTPFADTMVQMPLGQFILHWASLYSVNIGAFEQLTTAFLVDRGFNDRMPDRRGVRYFSYAGDVDSLRVFPPMIPSAEIIRRSEAGGDGDGDGGVRNDGLVPVKSATFRYGPVPGSGAQVLPIDHATQIGRGYAQLPVGPQSDFDHLHFYAELANALGRKGLYFTQDVPIVESRPTTEPGVAEPDAANALPVGQ
jgi:triacylglycerol lipase